MRKAEQVMARRLACTAVAAVAAVSVTACRAVGRATPSPAVTSAATVMTATTVPPTETPAPTDTPEPTATGEVPPAAGVTSTSAPPQQPTTVVTVTDAQATDLATQALASNPDALPVPLEHPRIAFTREAIRLAADVRGQGAHLEVLGTPEVDNGRVSFRLTSLKLNGLEVPFYRREVEDAINGIFARMTAGRRVKSVQLGDGTLTIVPDE